MYYMPEEVADLFKDFQLINGTPIMKGNVPFKIMEELQTTANICEDIRDGELSFLLRKRTPVSNNYFEMVVPKKYIQDSLTYAFLRYAAALFNIKLNNPNVYEQFDLRKDDGKLDAYDFWINFYKSGNHIEPHDHGGDFSGIIYFTDNFLDATTFNIDDNYYSHFGKKGEILIFPSTLPHWTDPLKSTEQKISFSFNLIKINV